MKLEIVTPEKKALTDEVDQVSLPTPKGEITVLSHHIPLVSSIVPGEIIVKKGDKYSYFAIGDGFVEVTGDRVSILADLADAAEGIDEKSAEEARVRAEEAMKNRHNLSQEEFAFAAANLQKALASLKVKRRHHNKIH